MLFTFLKLKDSDDNLLMPIQETIRLKKRFDFLPERTYGISFLKIVCVICIHIFQVVFGNGIAQKL